MEFKEYPYSKQIVERLRSGEIDLYLGIDNYQNLPEDSDRSSVVYLESLSITHAFINVKRKIFENDDFRRDFCPLIQGIVQTNARTQSPDMVYQPHFMPRGLLPWSYYSETRFEPLDPTSFIRKWKGRIKPGTIRIVATINQLDRATVAALDAALQDIGLRLEYISDFYGRSNDLIEKDDYDIRFSG